MTIPGRSPLRVPTRRFGEFASYLIHCALILGVALAMTARGAAAEPAKRAFDLPADDLGISLKRLAQQSGLEVIFQTDAVEGARTVAVQGEMDPKAALDAMLVGTGFEGVQDQKTGALAVRRIQLPNVARTAPDATTGGRPVKEDGTVVLDPFEVQTAADTSYGALNSNSITSFNTELDKMPVTADILTEAFMRDVDVTTLDSMILAYGGGVGMSYGNPAGQGATTQPGDRPGTNGFTMRGLASGVIRFNGFVSEASTTSTSTNFDIERVELIHGPQGLLYGPAGAGGTIVATTDQAKFDKVIGSVNERIDQYGSKRELIKVNVGADWAAVAVDLLNEEDNYRRLFFGSNDTGIYAQTAFRLPLHTTLRVDYEHTYQNKTGGGGGTPSVNFGSNAVDPRNGQNLAYLLFTNQVGPTNPATGAAFGGGAIDNGHVNWLNAYSYQGTNVNWELASHYSFDAIADTVWTPWLSTSVGFNYVRLNDITGPGAAGTLYAPGVSPNPYPNDWALDYTPGVSVFSNRRHKNFRADALVSNDLFGIAKSQTSVGYDFQRQGLGGYGFGYYLSDASGNEILTPGATNLGRSKVPLQWWTVDGGPVFQPPVQAARNAPIIYSPQTGQYFVKELSDPSRPQFVTPSNPRGLAGYAPGTGILASSDFPEENYEKEITSSGIFLANYTSWWNDLFTTLAGYRYTYTTNHIPNTGIGVPYGVYDTAKFGAPSYNLGVDGRITKWLRWFTDYSGNYNVGNGETDLYGRAIDVNHGKAWEGGLKFNPLDGRVSGSLDFYVNDQTDYAVNTGGVNTVLAAVNPVGLNGQFEGAFGAGTLVSENQRAQGLELNLNANPVPNWRVRLSATFQQGKNYSNINYGILYNDQFHTDGKGNVTYADGSPFLVPVTPGTSVSSLSTTVNPNTNILTGVPTTQLTTAMIGNPSSPYYAWQGGTPTAAGNILATSNVGKVLQYFNVPGAGTAFTGVNGLPISQIQYAWPDPNNTGGTVVIAQSGQATVGYPVYGINFVNTYEISRGPLKGLGAVLGLTDQWKWRTYYYNTPATGAGLTRQLLWGQSSLGVLINLNPFYECKIGRFHFRTQLDITNLTNHYKLELLPNNGSGFTNPNNLNVRWDNQPRFYSWSNTLSF